LRNGRIEQEPFQCAKSKESISAFTLLETLVALLISTILITVSARSMMSVLQADETAIRLCAGACVARTVTCREWLDSPMAETVYCGSTIWDVSSKISQSTDGLMLRDGTERVGADSLSGTDRSLIAITPRSRASYSITLDVER